MKKIATSIIVCILFFLSLEGKAQAEQKILFLGNSHTFHNNVPKLLEEVAALKGDAINAEFFAPGGWTLKMHAKSREASAKIREKDWDYIVLQEQSVAPAVEQRRKYKMYPAARMLARKVQRTDAMLMFYMTWARKRGMPKYNFPDYFSMQKEITLGYNQIAEQTGALVAPVGIAWQKALEGKPQLNLWEQDGNHANLKGSYLAACVFYAVLFHKSPEGIEDHLNIGEDASYLQKIAAEVVLQ